MSAPELRILQAGQHARQLADPAGPVQADHAAGRDQAVARLGHDQVVVGERRHLRQVRHHDHLGQPREPGEGRRPTPDELGWPPGYFENVIGSIDDPAFKRYPLGEFEVRESLE